jgi:hypothetical protein
MRFVTVAVAAWALVLSLATLSAAKGQCTPDYQKVPLAKISANLADFDGCKVEVEAQFAMVHNAMMSEMLSKSLPGEYRKHAHFMLAGTTDAAGLPKEKSDVIYTLAAGDKIRIRGVVVSSAAKMESRWGVSSGAGSLYIAADSVEKIGSAPTFPGLGVPESAAQPAAPAAKLSADEVKAQLAKLKEMLDAGLITQEEYDKKKQELLSRM